MLRLECKNSDSRGGETTEADLDGVGGTSVRWDGRAGRWGGDGWHGGGGHGAGAGSVGWGLGVDWAHAGARCH